MPEAPECRVIAEGLDRILRGRDITQIEVLSGRYARHGNPQGFSEFKDRLPWQCCSVNVKGKFIYFTMGDFSGMGHIWNTLGMSGSWLKQRTSHARVRLSIAGVGDVYFTDPRNFGTLKFSFGGVELRQKLQTLGLDLLNDDVSQEAFNQSLRRKKNMMRTLAEVLMDQTCFAGIGNYIKAESLYRARLSPHRTVSSLDDGDIGGLYLAVLDVIRGSYAARGMSMSDYTDVDGVIGTFTKVVYGKSKDPDGRQVITEETKDGRTTHWVPGVQR